MKNIVNILKDPAARKFIAVAALNGVTVYMLYKSGFENGSAIGGAHIFETAERMSPGFTEQFQKFISAEHYGWKS